MAGFLTDYSNNKVLDGLFGAVPFTAPATLYFGLSRSSASKAGVVSEPNGGAYARVALANDLARFPAASGGTKTNAAVINFAIPSADWGSITSVFIADSATGGNVLAMADLPAVKTILTGSPAPSIAVGALYLSHT